MSDLFLKLLDKRRIEYKTYTPLFCPVLRSFVHFQSDGFNHLRFRTDGTPRKASEQMYKLGLLPLVRPVISNAVISQYKKELAPIGRKKLAGKKVLKEIEYWGLITIVGKRKVKIKVVLRKIGNGKIHFWSVMKLAENVKTPKKGV